MPFTKHFSFQSGFFYVLYLQERQDKNAQVYTYTAAATIERTNHLKPEGNIDFLPLQLTSEDVTFKRAGASMRNL